jgi:predicted nucleic-acid-binding protein
VGRWRARELLRSGERLILVDLVVAEVVFVLESVYEVERDRLAQLVRAILAFPALVVTDELLLLRTVELFEEHRVHFVDVYLAACAEASGVEAVASFDRDIDRIASVRRPDRGT